MMMGFFVGVSTKRVGSLTEFRALFVTEHLRVHQQWDI